MPYVTVEGRDIPVVRETDVVVAGGSLPAIAAALAAAEAGRSVLVVAPRLYLGQDRVDTLQLTGQADGPLTDAVFGETGSTTPLRLKKQLEDALCQAGIPFLLGTDVTQLVIDSAGHAAGIVTANRAGRQAIRARSVIDAKRYRDLSDALHAWSGPITAERTVIGGKAAKVQATHSFTIPTEGDVAAHRYCLEQELAAWSQSALAELEQQARDLTYRPGQLRASDRVSLPALDKRDSIPGLFALHAQTEGSARARGKEAAEWAARQPIASDVRVAILPPAGEQQAELRENLQGLRPTDAPSSTVCQPPGNLPVLATVDVLVAGGGTAGISAAIAAAREGKSVLVLEYQGMLGGVGTAGLIGKAYGGQDIGHALEVPFPDERANMDAKTEWFRQELRHAGGQLWFQTLIHGAWTTGARVCGAYVTTPFASGLVRAGVVIDATGNADLAIAAGADYFYGADAEDIAMQGTGTPLWPLGATYVNTDYLLVDETDIVDVTAAVAGMRRAVEPEAAFDGGSFIQTRERRRVKGDLVLQYLDQVLGRTYPDSIVFSSSDYDSHGYPSLPYFALLPHTAETRLQNHPAPSASPYTPYRCLLPKGLEGILVVGLGISMHRDASAMVRMQKDVHNQGFAAGLAAAMALDSQVTPRGIDIRALQTRLIELGALPASVLTDEDSFPLPTSRLTEAVNYLAQADVDFDRGAHALAVVFTQTDAARPILRTAFSDSRGPGRLRLAGILGFLGVADGVDELEAALASAPWDARILQGRMAEYAHLPTPTDALVLALGYSGSATVIGAITASMQELDADSTLSHHRAVALALEHLGSAQAAEPLATLLGKPRMSGHVMTAIEPLIDKDHARRRREGPLREIVLARALYRCGDHQGRGEAILRAYTQDVRALFARHAKAVLGSNDRQRGCL